mgnify:CR=1 FL=1
MTQALAIQEQTTEVVPIDPTDARAWELVNSVLTWMGESACYSYSEAFRQLGVSRASFYRAIKRPLVQGKIIERMDAQDSAVAKMLEDTWVLVVGNMLRLAQGNGREAVSAARFLAQQKEKLHETGDRPKPEGKSEARALLERFMGTSKPVAARRTVLTEEVELAPREGMSGVVVEG